MALNPLDAGLHPSKYGGNTPVFRVQDPMERARDPLLLPMHVHMQVVDPLLGVSIWGHQDPHAGDDPTHG